MARKRKRVTRLFFRRRGKVHPIRGHPGYDPLKAGEIPKHLRAAVIRSIRRMRSRRSGR